MNYDSTVSLRQNTHTNEAVFQFLFICKIHRNYTPLLSHSRLGVQYIHIHCYFMSKRYLSIFKKNFHAFSYIIGNERKVFNLHTGGSETPEVLTLQSDLPKDIHCILGV